MERRSFIRLAAASGAAGVTGCLDGDGPADDDTANETDGNDTDGDDGDGTPPDRAEVTVAPQGALRFEPEHVEVALGGTVEWYFASAGHNVTSHPGASDKCENPEGAEPFTSYEGDRHYVIEPPGSRFEHSFDTPGEYTYVCDPHASTMVGTVTVVEV